MPREDNNSLVPEPRYILLLNSSLLVILVFLLTSKVFSPQYLIWLLPLIPFLVGKWKVLTILIFILVSLMTFFVYPEYYGALEKSELLVVEMLALRNAALIIMAVLLAHAGPLSKMIPNYFNESQKMTS